MGSMDLIKDVVEIFQRCETLHQETRTLDPADRKRQGSARFHRAAYAGKQVLDTLYDAHTSFDQGIVPYTMDNEATLVKCLPATQWAVTAWVWLTLDRFPPHCNVASSKRERSGLEFFREHYEGLIDAGLVLCNEEVDEWTDRLQRLEDVAEYVTEWDLPNEQVERLPESHTWAR